MKHGLAFLDNRGARLWELDITAEIRRYLSNITDWELWKIIQLKRRGLGLTEIAKSVYGERSKRYRVWRILKRLERMGVLECILDQHCVRNMKGDNGHVASSVSVQHESDDRDTIQETELGGPLWLEPPESRRIPRLGMTQRLVLAGLMVQGPWGATPGMIASYIAEHGIMLTRNAVWHSLRRLMKRGLVERMPGGFYRLVSRWSGILVENLVVRGRPVWSNVEYNRPASLEEALTLAALRDRVFPVDRVETFNLPNRLLGEARILKKTGWRMTLVYLNDSIGLKAESRFYNPVIPAHPAYLEQWNNLHVNSLCIAKKALEEALYKLGHRCASTK